MRRITIAAVCLVPLVAVAGCSSSSSSSPSASPTAASPSAAASEGTGTNGVTVTGDLGEQPTVTIDTAQQPPTELIVEELKAGDGPAIKPNSEVTVQYVGSSWSSGQVFQSSWEGSGALTFPLNGVIPGWQEGLVGLKQGTRALLIIPPEKAYGANPPPGSGINPNETLVFVVDVEKVK